ncbi:MAG TPA: Xaa-Pro peptidase family protein [bacterium]|nr:Xaa-Pro peptidase family protein [bacterium]
MKPTTPRDEVERRIGALQRHLGASALDAALIVQNIDLFYFTGSMQSGALIVPAAGRAVYAVRRVLERARQHSPLEQIIPFDSFRQLPDLVRAAAGAPVRRIGLELDVVPVLTKDRIAAAFEGAEWADVSPAIRAVRSVKSPFELDRIRAAAGLSVVMLEAATQSLREGMTELELAGRVEAAARRAGHQGQVPMRGWNQAVFFGQLSSGEASALQSFPDIPLAGEGPSPASPIGAGRRRIVAGEPVILDYVAALDGYLCDQTRTLSIGALPEKFARAHDAAVAILRTVQGVIRPGTTPQALYRRALELAKEFGVADHFMGHGQLRARYLGHGVGLELDEWPILADGWTQPLEVGQVFCVEPKIVFPGEGAVGIEDQFAVTADGSERLTRPEQRLFRV